MPTFLFSKSVLLQIYRSEGVSAVSAADTWLSPKIGDHWEMRVLVAEDHGVLARTIGVGLQREGMAVDVALDGADALDRLAVTRYDVGWSLIEICRRLMETTSAATWSTSASKRGY